MKKKQVKKHRSGIIRVRKPKVKIEAPEPPVEKVVVEESQISLEPTKEILKEVEKEVGKEEVKKEEKKVEVEKKVESKKDIELPLSPKADRESQILKMVGIILCVIIMLFWLVLAILSTEYNSGPKIVQKNVSVTSFTTTTASFDKFMNITDVKYIADVSQIGYLRQEVTDKGITKKYLIDDRGRKIELMLRGLSQGEQYDSLFVTDETSKQLYNVSGIYRYEMNRFVIEVDTIVTAEKKTTEKTEWRVENITTDDVKGFTFSIARGVNKLVTINYTG